MDSPVLIDLKKVIIVTSLIIINHLLLCLTVNRLRYWAASQSREMANFTLHWEKQ